MTFCEASSRELEDEGPAAAAMTTAKKVAHAVNARPNMPRLRSANDRFAGTLENLEIRKDLNGEV